MTAFLKLIKVLTGVMILSVMAACTTASVEDNLAAQPLVTETAIKPQTTTEIQNAETIQQANANALGAQTTPSPSQNVTESQLQQQTNTQVQSTGLADPAASIQAPAQEVASLDTSKALTFLPFEGAPQTKTASLIRLLNTSAQTNGLTILPATRTGAKYKVKGYFSALNDGNGTLLVYVWDVVDGTGKRLHRINGRERTGTSRTDPWQAITDQEMQRVAQATTSRLKTWIDTR